MSWDDLDPVLNSPKRLAAMGAIANAQKVEFSFIRDHLKLSDSDLSKQMAALAQAGYVNVKKVGKGRNRKTWYSATRGGQKALKSHVAALNDLATTAIVGTGLAQTQTSQ